MGRGWGCFRGARGGDFGGLGGRGGGRDFCTISPYSTENVFALGTQRK